jgi:ferritin-like metal-binding protein YciE
MPENLLEPWLNYAYAMENAVIEVFELHHKQASEHPTLGVRLESHLDATKRHALAIKGCLERLNQRVSPLKAGTASLIGTLQAVATSLLGDPMLRNLLADYSAQKYQIGVYRALRAVATELGDVETAQVCQEILREEEDMARWLGELLPTVAVETLRQKAAS